MARVISGCYSNCFHYSDVIAAAHLRCNDQELCDTIEDALFGNNQQAQITTDMIRCIIMSGDDKLIGDLLKLLKAAKNQEGVRQEILEAADAGSKDTLMRILCFCLDEDLFRFSATIRALGTWIGIPVGADDRRRATNLARHALEVLESPKRIHELLASESAVDLGLALWGLGVEDLSCSDAAVDKLLADPVPYRRLVGWYFLLETRDTKRKMAHARKHLDEQDQRVLTLVLSCLTSTKEILYPYRGKCYRKEHGLPLKGALAVPNPNLPDSRNERIQLFGQLEEIAHRIGKKRYMFKDMPYIGCQFELRVHHVLGCLMSLAGYDDNPELLQRLYGLTDLMDYEEKDALISAFLSPETIPADRDVLLSLLGDRTIDGKMLAVDRLSHMSLRDKDFQMLAGALTSKSATLRRSIMTLLAKQPWESLKNPVASLLETTNDHQNQAGIELISKARKVAGQDDEEGASAEAFLTDAHVVAALEELRGRKLPAQTGTQLEALESQEKQGQWNIGNGFGLYDPMAHPDFETTYSPLFADGSEGTTEPDSTPDAEANKPQGDTDVTPVDEPSSTPQAPQRGFFSHIIGRIFGSGSSPLRIGREDSVSDVSLSEATVCTERMPITSAKELKAPSITDGLMTFDQLSEYADFDGLSHIIRQIVSTLNAHDDYEYEVERTNGHRELVLFGTDDDLPLPAEQGSMCITYATARIGMLPFADEFREIVAPYTSDADKLLRVLYAATEERQLPARHYAYDSWYRDIAHHLDRTLWYRCRNEYGLQRTRQAYAIVSAAQYDCDQSGLFNCIMHLYESFIHLFGSRLYDSCDHPEPGLKNEDLPAGTCHPYNSRMLQDCRYLIQRMNLTDGQFCRWFKLEHCLETRVPKDDRTPISYCLDIEDHLRACELGLVNEEDVARFIFTSPDMRRIIERISRRAGHDKDTLADRHPWARDLFVRICSRLVDMEELRGELPTTTSELCWQIGYVEGAHHFARILAALGDDNLSTSRGWYVGYTKRDTLTHLLGCCYPARTDTPERLSELRQEYGISDRRMVEAAVYSPQWAGLIEGATGWDGLQSGVWFLYAHVSHVPFAARETEVARFSSISLREFKDGRFDQEWFRDVYTRLGEKRFDVLYHSAKHIAPSGSYHRRVQLFSDAALGRLDEQTLEKEIITTRSKDRLLCYPLIPYDRSDKETLHRYQFIRSFEASSKKFGSQRRASEQLAAEAALGNLARAAGYENTDRLTWHMEGAQINNVREYLEPRELGKWKVWIEISELGKAILAVDKQGKRLKHVPKPIAKDAYVVALKVKVKELLAQQRRGCEILERAMIERAPFSAEELRVVLTNPVVGALMKGLVLTDGTTAVWAQDFDQLDPNAICIAHPLDLKKLGVWPTYMHDVCEHRIVQPFKQVFRELYPITADERQNRMESRRYAGNQIKMRQTLAMLKSRGWTIDYEDGLQKVWHKEGIAARILALADWFSPADIEPPTIETVEFFKTATWKNVPLTDISPIVFSETMRDVDLVISVAHAGGVDPETSHSTAEMRTAIVKQLIELLGIKNVQIDGIHAKITGKLATWSVHLGSGIVHARTKGMVAIVPVHSQQRGRIFLPFADEDPKTAEVLSKVLLLADDAKIKDANILDQLR